MQLIYGVEGWEKLNIRGTIQMIIREDIKCEMQSTKYKVQNTKYKTRNKSSNYNYKCEYDTFLYLSPTFFISFFSPFPTNVSPSQLGTLRDAPRNIRITTLLHDLRIVYSNVRMTTLLHDLRITHGNIRIIT